MPRADVHLSLDDTLVKRAAALGPLDDVVERSLRQTLDPTEIARRRRWAEDNALMLEAMAGGAEEMAAR